MNPKIYSPKWNIMALVVIIAISTLLIFFADYGNSSAGMEILVIVWIPLIFGILTALLYGLSRLIGKKYNWIITLLGILLMLYISIPIFFGIAT